MRVFLANYIVGGDAPVSINQVHRIMIGDAVSGAYHKVNGGRYDPSAHLDHLRQRDAVMRGIASNGADLNFVKTHSLNGFAFGTRLIDPMYTRAAIYVVRDPRDVAVSYARHYAQTPSQACRSISRPDHSIRSSAALVEQYLGDWSDHVRDWTGARGFPVHTMRYEDMNADAHDAFRKVLAFVGMPVDEAKLDRAIRFSSFEELSAQERKNGFIERSRNSDAFFHTGTTRQWETALTPEDLAFMETKHGSAMRRFGYL